MRIESKSIKKLVLIQKNKDLDKNFTRIMRLYSKNREDFLKWLEMYSKDYRQNIISTLDFCLKKKFKTANEVIGTNERTIKAISVSYRVFFNYLFLKGFISYTQLEEYKARFYIKLLSNIDKRFAKDEDISILIEHTKKRYLKEIIFLRVLLESGQRIKDLEHFFSNFNIKDFEIKEDVCSYPNFYLRGYKYSYYIYISRKTYLLLKENKELMKNYDSSGYVTYIKRNKLIPLKYIRKYNFTKLIENNIPFDIANFMQGRNSRNVGINHYLYKNHISLQEYNKVTNVFLNMFE